MWWVREALLSVVGVLATHVQPPGPGPPLPMLLHVTGKHRKLLLARPTAVSALWTEPVPVCLRVASAHMWSRRLVGGRGEERGGALIAVRSCSSDCSVSPPPPPPTLMHRVASQPTASPVTTSFVFFVMSYRHRRRHCDLQSSVHSRCHVPIHTSCCFYIRLEILAAKQ
jgi:hypothetical protein